MKILTLILTTLIFFKPVIGNTDINSADSIYDSFINCEEVSYERVEAYFEGNKENLVERMKNLQISYSAQRVSVFRDIEIEFMKELKKPQRMNYLESTKELPFQLLDSVRLLITDRLIGIFE